MYHDTNVCHHCRIIYVPDHCHYIGEKYSKQLVWPTGYWLLPQISLLCKGYSFNPLSPKSDQHQISPCNINALSNRVVMRIRDKITQDEFA